MILAPVTAMLNQCVNPASVVSRHSCATMLQARYAAYSRPRRLPKLNHLQRLSDESFSRPLRLSKPSSVSRNGSDHTLEQSDRGDADEAHNRDVEMLMQQVGMHYYSAHAPWMDTLMQLGVTSLVLHHLFEYLAAASHRPCDLKLHCCSSCFKHRHASYICAEYDRILTL